MQKSEALELLHSKMSSLNLRKHCYSVAAVMRVLAKHFGEDANLWEVAGLLHDADYEKYPDRHPNVIIEELEKRKEDPKLISAIRAHAWGYRDEFPKPVTKFEWALYTCDELTGLIVACALVRPEKKLSTVTVENVMKKWGEKSFAAGVKREDIKHCEKELGIKLPDFIKIALTAMQGISEELGL